MQKTLFALSIFTPTDIQQMPLQGIYFCLTNEVFCQRISEPVSIEPEMFVPNSIIAHMA